MKLHSYDKYIVSFSGGKDSIALVLFLLEAGVPPEKIELWHHNVDGEGGSFMDWEITEDYCRKFAEAFGIAIYFQWKQGGFKREMLRDNQPTAPIYFEVPGGGVEFTGGKGDKGTRFKFPQTSADLSVRWCSAYLKIDVCAIAIRNQSRFNNIKTLVLSGERGEESAQRAKYQILEADRADLRNGKKFFRLVDRYRAIRDWTEQQVWEIIERHRVRVHPCYYMGWGRCSCKFCIFGNANQFASANLVSPDKAEEIMMYEESFDKTIKPKISVRDLVAMGTPYKNITTELAKLATQSIYYLQIIIPKTEEWLLPAGAYGDNCGSI